MQKLPKLCRQKSKVGHRAYVKIQNKKYYCGVYGTSEAKENYLKILSDWTVNKQLPLTSKKPVPPKVEPQKTVTIKELLSAHLVHVKSYYVKNSDTICGCVR